MASVPGAARADEGGAGLRLISATALSFLRIGRVPTTIPRQLDVSPLRARLVRWADSPVILAAVAALAAVAFVLLRMAVAGHGNIASFIIVGKGHVDRATLAHGVPVFPVVGYDGQFYYRLAIDPLAWAHQAFGVTFDVPYRISRIGYPTLAWLLAGGHAFLVPVSLVAANVLALAVAVGCAAGLARDAGRSGAWGLLVAGYWGFLWTMARDLTELVAAAALLAGLLAIRRRHFAIAGLLLAIAVLSKETALLLVGTIALARLVGWVRAATGRRPLAFAESPGELTRSGPGWEDATWLVPLAAFVGWQLTLWARLAAIPLVSSDRSNSGPPFAGLADGFRHYLHLLPAHDAVIWMGEVAVLAVIVAGAAWCFAKSRVLVHERLAWIGFLVLAVCLDRTIWLGDVGLRSLDDLFLFSGIILLYSSRRLRIPGALIGITWAVVYVELIRTI